MKVFRESWRVLIILVLVLCLGCATAKPAIPTMDLPPEPVKPKINFVVIQHQNESYLALKVGQGLQLLEYLIRLDALGQQYRNRITAINQHMTNQ